MEEISALKNTESCVAHGDVARTARDFSLGVEWEVKMVEQRYSDELSQLKRSETAAYHANNELEATTARHEARSDHESRQCNEMARLRETEETQFESRLHQARVAAGYSRSEQSQCEANSPSYDLKSSNGGTERARSRRSTPSY